MKQIKENKTINHSIDVRYEEDVLVAFNKFIEKWCGDYYPHLIDNDENDGEFMRDKIRKLKTNTQVQSEKEQVLREFVEELKLEKEIFYAKPSLQKKLTNFMEQFINQKA